MSHPVKPTPHGLVFKAINGTVYAPLKSVSVNASIVDVSARVTVMQTYSAIQHPQGPTAAQYIFPVPAQATVCAFELHTALGKRIRGIVKEGRKAQKEFRKAVSENKTAGLLTETAADVFTIALGAIPSGEEIQVFISYVTYLDDDALLKQVRFSLPLHIGCRYGNPPDQSMSSLSSSHAAEFTFSAHVRMTSDIRSITSSHQVIITEPSTNERTVKLDRGDVAPRLDKEFVLSIQADSLDAPRCIAEYIPSKKSVAMSLSLVPRFGIDPIENQEYIFVVDRSGSIRQEDRIGYAKRAILIFLKSLPSSGTTFNIYSFGKDYASLWPTSQPYNQANLEGAVQYVESMEANMGGTEINAALSHVFAARSHKMPTSVFVLTDGDVWRPQEVFATVRTAMDQGGDSTSGHYLRVFTLGVGRGASTALCQGVARNGNGICLMTTQSEEVAGKCAKLLSASRVPPIGNMGSLEVDWGYKPSSNPKPKQPVASSVPTVAQTKPSSINLFDEDFDPLIPKVDIGPREALPEIQDVQQAPSVVPDIYPGNRFMVSAILSNVDNVPDTVILHGRTPTGQSLELKVPVKTETLQLGVPPLVHTLAAHRIIQELDDDNLASLGDIDTSITGPFSSVAGRNAMRNAAVVRLGEEYQLASRLTSFVAVEDKESGDKKNNSQTSEWRVKNKGKKVDDQDHESDTMDEEDDFELIEQVDTVASLSTVTSPVYRIKGEMYNSAPEDGSRGFGFESMQRLAYSPAPLTQGPSLNNASIQAVPFSRMHARQQMQSQSQAPGRFIPRGPPTRRRPTPTRSAQVSSAAMIAQPQSAPSNPPQASSFGASGGLGTTPFASGSLIAQTSIIIPNVISFGSSRAEDPITVIARLQSFDGSWEPAVSLWSALSKTSDYLTTDKMKNSIPPPISKEPSAEILWTTAIVAAYLKVKLTSERDVWSGLFDKARTYVLGKLPNQGGFVFERLVSEAEKVL